MHTTMNQTDKESKKINQLKTRKRRQELADPKVEIQPKHAMFLDMEHDLTPLLKDTD